ncbi:MAG TPA: type II secretion system protein N [Gammaproteobacteria bacterium]|nr:type II secretion system protein N [Gammaproteobacteria bacterium]
MKKRYYITTAIISYLLFLIATIPARPVARLLNDDGMVLIQGVSGTLWNGRARMIDIDEIAQLDDTEWTISGWKMLMGKIAADVTTHYSDDKIRAGFGMSFPGRYFIDHLDAKISAEEVARLANIPLAQLSGMISIDIEHAQWKQGELPLATGKINWKDATVTVMDTASLGDITIILSESEEQLLNADIKNQGGDIKINGKAELVPDADYAVEIKLRPTASASNNIKQSLEVFAKRQNNGEYLLKNSGPLNQIGIL